MVNTSKEFLSGQEDRLWVVGSGEEPLRTCEDIPSTGIIHVKM